MATDRDNDVVTYELLGPEEALDFFFINPVTGNLSVTKPLYGLTESRYKVNNHTYTALRS